jgi:hypothetical protein
VSQAVAKRTGWALTHLLIALIVSRLRAIKWRFARLAARVAAGTYKPRAPREQAADQPRPAPPRDKLPRKFGWLRPLIPETVAFAGMLDGLLREPEMAALLAAAPAALGRPIRSLCRMLGVAPPKILAPPPSPPRPKPPRKPKIPRDDREAGFSPERPMGRVRYVFGLRYPPPFKNPA